MENNIPDPEEQNINLSSQLQGQMNSPCPQCGYCPTCGRPRYQEWPRYYGPYWGVTNLAQGGTQSIGLSNV